MLNNHSFATERCIREGWHNNVHEWVYYLLPTILRRGWGGQVHTKASHWRLLSQARTNTKNPPFPSVHLDPLDQSKAPQRLGKRLGERA